MTINRLLKQKNMTKYKLSKASGVPYATVSEIVSGKTGIEKCTGATLYRLAKALDVTMEDLVEGSVLHRCSFDTYKSNVCHLVKYKGDLGFIIETLETDKIRRLYNRGWYPECLYLLAMLDYLSRENGLPFCNEYDDLRAMRFPEPIFPSSVIALSVLKNNDQPKNSSIDGAIPEFLRHNIVEGEIRNVC